MIPPEHDSGSDTEVSLPNKKDEGCSFIKPCYFDLSYPVAYYSSSLSLKNRLYVTALSVDSFDKRLTMHPGKAP